jgi:hypothetical protein
MVTFDQVGVKKPAPEPFQSALALRRAVAGEPLVVGDNPHRNIKACRALGIKTVYTKYGDRFFRDRGQVPADFMIDRYGRAAGDFLPAIAKQEVAGFFVRYRKRGIKQRYPPVSGIIAADFRFPSIITKT